MSDGNEPIEPGRRIDGKPYKEGNTREDGSFRIGKNRPSDEHKFRVDDGRKRGVRGKGRKNLLTEWREELDAKITVTEGGKTKKVTKRRALIKSKIDRGIKKSDRAAETALKYAELSERREPGLQSDDLVIIEAWLAAQQVRDSDDADQDISAAIDVGSGDGVSGDA